MNELPPNTHPQYKIFFPVIVPVWFHSDLFAFVKSLNADLWVIQA